jgi:hypothetical protein
MVEVTTIPPTITAAARAAAPAHAHSGRWSKWVLLGVAGLCYVMTGWVAGQLGVSRTRGFDGSLLLSPAPVANLLVTAVLVFAAIAMGTLLAGGIRPDAGLFAAAATLLALSNRGRPIYAVLHDTNGSRAAYSTMAAELLVLGGLLGAGWWVLHRLQQRGSLHRDSVRDGLPDIDHPPGVGWSELATHVLVTAAVVVLVAQSEDKKQVLAAVGIGSFVAAFFPHWKHGARPSIWYWPGPILVGILGYLLAAFTVPTEALFIGRPGRFGGFLNALARPLPLDYASIGTAGALIGYWMRRTSVREREAMNA